MEFIQTAAVAAVWFWAGRQWSPRKLSSGDRMQTALFEQLVKLKSTMRIVGAGPAYSVTSEWKFGSYGKVKITLEPLPDTVPAADAEVG